MVAHPTVGRVRKPEEDVCDEKVQEVVRVEEP